MPARAPASPAAPTAEARALVLEVHARLAQAFGAPIPYFHALPPLDELVSSLLSHRTKNADSGLAFKTLRARFPSWEAVRDAPVAAVEAAISAATWPEAKAPALQRTLRAITERAGQLTLEPIDGLNDREAQDWLLALPGVGPKTAAAVLSFSILRRRALPVDSHHHRVAIRLGLIPAKLAVGPSHAVLEAQLPAEWNAQAVYDNHEVLMLHGQHRCHFQGPKCRGCVLLDLCPDGARRLALEPQAA